MRREIQKRLINLSVDIISYCKELKTDFVSQHLSQQIIRASTSCALHYGEAQGASSMKDFVHKSSEILKELRETQAGLQIIRQSNLAKNDEKAEVLYKECSELVAIFHKIVMTAKAKINN